MAAIDVAAGPPEQDFIVLGGLPSPGFAYVKGAGAPREWKINNGFGMGGATVDFMGQRLSEFDVDIYCWEAFHFEAWKLFASQTLTNPPLGARPTSMSIQHPALNDAPLSITQVVVKNVTQWDQGPDGSGLWCRTISFLEYRKPRPQLVRPFEGPPGSPVTVAPPVDPELLIIQANSAAIAKLAGS